MSQLKSEVPRKRRRFTEEFTQDAVRLVVSGGPKASTTSSVRRRKRIIVDSGNARPAINVAALIAAVKNLDRPGIVKRHVP